MHFFTEPANLIATAQSAAQAFGPLSTDAANKFNVSSEHTVSGITKVFACQDAMMLVQPNVDAAGIANPELVNIILKPIEGLQIPLQPVKYYIYRGVDRTSFLAGGVITPAHASNTAFIAKLWADWNAYKTNTNQPSGTPDPTPESFGFRDDLSNSTNRVHLVEEYFNSSNSANTAINDFQAIKVTEGQWIGNVAAGTTIDFEIITDTSHMVIDLAYVQLSKQVIDATAAVINHATPTTPPIATREKVLNYIDPAAFFGMHFNIGVTVDGSGLRRESDLVTDILRVFFNKEVVYLDIRSEKGYSYGYYQNYRTNHMTGTTLSSSTILKIKTGILLYDELDYMRMAWPLINLKNPPPSLNPIVAGRRFHLKLAVKDNTHPLVFIENPKLLGANNRDHFIPEATLIQGVSPDFTERISIETPFYDPGTGPVHVANHIRLQYFRQVDNAASPASVFKTAHYLDGVFGGIRMPELNVANPFQNVVHTKRHFVKGSNFAFVADTGVFLQNNLVLFYAENTFSVTSSGNVFPRFDPSVTTPAGILQKKNIVYNRRRINDGVANIDLLDIVGYNRNTNERTPEENIHLLGLTKAELDAIDAATTALDLHQKYFLFEEVLNAGNPLEDTITHIPYRKFRLKVQGVDSNLHIQHIDAFPPVGTIHVLGSKATMLCSPNFTAASSTGIPYNLPDPAMFTEFDHFHRIDYDSNDPIIEDLFPGGTVTVNDNGNNTRLPSGAGIPSIPTPQAGLIGELFIPVENAGDTTISTRRSSYPLVVICNANGGRYSDYRTLAGHLARNGFVVSSISGLLYNNLNVFKVALGTTLPLSTDIHFNLTITPAFVSSSYFVINQFFVLDQLYIYDNDPANPTYEKLIILRGVRTGSVPPFTFTVTSQDVLGWRKGTDFDIFIEPTAFTWERRGGPPAPGLSPFGVAWRANTATTARISKIGTRLVELTAADWALSSHEAIKNAIDLAVDVSEVAIPFPSPSINRVLGVIVNDMYLMLRINTSVSGACSAGTCIQIHGEMKSRQIRFKVNVGQHGMGILGRANLVYPHLQFVKRFFHDTFPTTSLENNIALLGHSRGAEAVVRCARDIADTVNVPRITVPWTGADPRTAPHLWRHVPNDLHQVKAVISLAPTDQSSTAESIDGNIPYFVLYGSLEGDVIGEPTGMVPNRTSGFSIYDRSNNDTEKSMAFVYGATHNGFITNNADYIYYTTRNALVPVATLDTSRQQNIAKGYMNAFLRIHLKNEALWKPIFYGEHVPSSAQHNEIYLQYKDMDNPVPAAKWIVDSEGGGVPAATISTPPAAGIPPSTTVADEFVYAPLIMLSDHTPHDTIGLKVNWTTHKTLTFNAGGRDVTAYDYISFRIGHVYDSGGGYTALDTLKIKLTDTGTGQFERELNRTIPNPHHRDDAISKSAMMTIRLPLAEFGANGVNLAIVNTLQLTFPSGTTGTVLMDDIEFTK